MPWVYVIDEPEHDDPWNDLYRGCLIESIRGWSEDERIHRHKEVVEKFCQAYPEMAKFMRENKIPIKFAKVNTNPPPQLTFKRPEHYFAVKMRFEGDNR